LFLRWALQQESIIQYDVSGLVLDSVELYYLEVRRSSRKAM
jgi:hypothetical protein